MALGRRGAAVGVISLGCPKNLVDTEVMLGLLRQAGLRVVPDLAQADVVIVNTCCFIEPARAEAAGALAEAAQWRRAGEDRRLVCAGCWPELEAAALRARFPEIDALMGPGDVPDVVSIVERAFAGAGQKRPEAPPSAFLADHTAPRVRATAPWTAYLKIADGCRHGCTFCLIPRLRGPQRSRPLDSVLAEARRMADEGVREVVLIAQDSTAYGRDTGGPDIADLLHSLAEVEGLRWLRLLYGHPGGVTPRLIEAMAAHEHICRYLDIPLQHADPAVLRRMGRSGDGDAYLALIEKLRAAMPDIAIRSSFIVGFPGEGEDEFRRLIDFIEAARLDRAGAFCYSPESGTPAAAMDGRAPLEVAEQRYHEVMVAQQRVSLEANRRWVGRELEVLLEASAGRRGEWIGRSFRDAPEIDGSVTVSGLPTAAAGAFITARVVAAEPYDLAAEPARRGLGAARGGARRSRGPDRRR